MAGLFRESASLIVLARHTKKLLANDFNYKVLVFKRTERTSFMPNSIVFPGGAIDKQDELNEEWSGFFKSLNVSKQKIDCIKNKTTDRPPIFRKENRDVTLRLTALRETFEELGVLITPNTDEDFRKRGYSSFVKDVDILNWQQKIHDHQTNFVELYKSLNVLPDLWNCYEWSDWLTPTSFKTRRFETAFYLVVLDEMPNVVPEPTEVAQYMWDTPDKLLAAHNAEKLWLAPPQHYEISRLCQNFYNIDDVLNFAKSRNDKGSTVYMPAQFKCSDAMVHVLPGDDFYPAKEKLSYTEVHENIDNYTNLTAAEFKALAKRVHRSEHRSMHDIKVELNFEPLNGHVSPVPLPYPKHKL